MKEEKYNLIEKSYLIPEYTSQKSFYNKAYILKYYNKYNLIVNYELYSYNTLFLVLKSDKIYLNYNIENDLLFSNTTLKHIKEFLKQKYYLHNKIINNKKDIIKYSKNINELE